MIPLILNDPSNSEQPLLNLNNPLNLIQPPSKFERPAPVHGQLVIVSGCPICSYGDLGWNFQDGPVVKTF